MERRKFIKSTAFGISALLSRQGQHSPGLNSLVPDSDTINSYLNHSKKTIGYRNVGFQLDLKTSSLW